MPALIFAHLSLGLMGIASGLVAVAGVFYRKRLTLWNAVFLATTAAACGTGFVFLPISGITSAQIVGFFLIGLLAVAAYARYVRQLDRSWNQIYAFTTVGSLFLNILIATAQSFLHFEVLRTLAPTQHSPVYVAVKVTLLLIFIAIAIFVARRAGTS